MNYQTFQPGNDLRSLVKCYWILEVPNGNHEKQRIIPDGCIEMIFTLGDDIRRYISETDFILQPRAMVLGQTIDPFYIQPTGYVNSFAVRFYPYGFANFTKDPIHNFANKETPIAEVFGNTARLEVDIVEASDTQGRISLVETFLLDKLNHQDTINNIVQSTVDALLATKGSKAINSILQQDLSKRRQLERNFTKQIGISPKQLGKVIRLQTALKLLLNRQSDTLTQIAYESEYYDQNHFIKDFKEFTGNTPKDFLTDEQLRLSALIYARD